jgi:hypothetical protein
MRRRRTLPMLGQALGLLLLYGCVDEAQEEPAPPPPKVGTQTLPPRRLRRLSIREYNNVVRDLLGDDSRPADRFVAESYQNGYDNGSAGLAVQSDHVLAYQRAAEELSQRAVKDRMPRLLGGCDVAKQGEAACADAFFAGFVPRAFRRPLSATEEERLRRVFAAQAMGGFALGLQTVLEVILQSPQFLYREELGAPEAPNNSEPVPLTDHEVASELSFLLTGSLPDEALWSAVKEGRFKTPEDHRREAARLLKSDGPDHGAVKAALRAFLHKWLATDRLPKVSKDAAFYPTFSAAMAASMSGELDRFYDGVLWSGQGSLRELFTTSRSFADKTLGQLYGVPVSGAGFEPVELDAKLRKGVLSRAGYLAVHSTTDGSGPVSRGVFLLHSVLCMPPPQPPPNVPPVVPATDPMAKDLTTRQRFERHVSDPFCAGCHRQIDGVGFGFEQFDGIGAFRAMENGQPVDSRGVLFGPVLDSMEARSEYDGVSELAVKIAGTTRLGDCYIRQAYRYAMGQIEPPEDDLRALVPGFTSDAQMTDVLLAVIGSPLFRARLHEMGGAR